MEEIGRMLKFSLCITKEEDDVLCLNETVVKEGKSKSGIGLVGKLLTKHPFNIQSLKSVMMKLWKPGLSLTEIERDVFIFFFGTKADRLSDWVKNWEVFGSNL